MAEKQPANDDIKDQFRAALDAKHAHEQNANEPGEGEGRPKIHGAHGPAHTQRTFRRKSG